MILGRILKSTGPIKTQFPSNPNKKQIQQPTTRPVSPVLNRPGVAYSVLQLPLQE